MRKELAFLGELDDEDSVLVSKVAEWTELSTQKYLNKFTMFLNEHQRALCESVFSALCFDRFRFFGGFDVASRTLCGIFAPYQEQSDDAFPIRAVSFSFRSSDKLTHRDFLGCIMSLGISRETVGDIIVGDGFAVVFVTGVAADLVMSLEKVGRVGVKASDRFDSSLLPQQEFSELEAYVSSTRFDAVVSAAVHLSREKAALLIKRGLCELNYMSGISPDKKLVKGDVFSVRGYGKFVLSSISEPTRKDRLHIVIMKYL